jgi:hypothetical protein
MKGKEKGSAVHYFTVVCRRRTKTRNRVGLGMSAGIEMPTSFLRSIVHRPTAASTLHPRTPCGLRRLERFATLKIGDALLNKAPEYSVTSVKTAGLSRCLSIKSSIELKCPGPYASRALRTEFTVRIVPSLPCAVYVTAKEGCAAGPNKGYPKVPP